MFKNTLKRLGAIVMVLALAMSVMAVSAFAAEVDPDPAPAQVNAKITKTLTKDANTYAPNVSFSFTATAGNNTASDFATPTNAVTIGDATFAPAESDIGVTSLTADATITVDESAFTVNGVAHPGIYYYTVTENDVANTDITKDSAEKTLAVYVNNEGKVTGYTFYGQDDIKTGGFTNEYDTEADTTSLTITKTVTGSQGDLKKDFTFTVSVDGTADSYEVKKDNVVVTTLNKDNDYTDNVTLKNGESVVVTGLRAADEYTVTEATYTDYNTTIDNAGATVNDLTATGNMTAANTLTSAAKTVAYTNDKDVTTPTGVIMNIAPYALMLVLAGGIAMFFLRRRNAE